MEQIEYVKVVKLNKRMNQEDNRYGVFFDNLETVDVHVPELIDNIQSMIIDFRREYENSPSVIIIADHFHHALVRYAELVDSPVVKDSQDELTIYDIKVVKTPKEMMAVY